MAVEARSLPMRAWMHVAALVFVVCCPPIARDAEALMPMPLTDTVWSWRSTAAANGSVTPVSTPDLYTVQLVSDGTVRVRADCNRGAGTYRSNDVELRFECIGTTKRGCPAGSRGAEFVAALARIESYRFEGTDLLAIGGGATLRFRPQGS